MKNSKELSVNVEETLMTTKQIAEILQVKPKLVIDTGKRLFPSRVKNGVTTYWTEREVTEISKTIKSNIGKGNSSIPFVQKKGLPSTHLEVLERAGNALKDLMTVISDMKAEADIAKSRVVAVEAENKMLKHQIEYNKVIDCTRWKDVKKLLGIKENWETVCGKLNLEEDIDYYKKCMGDDKWPTTMLTDDAVSRIKEDYCK